VEEDDLGFVVVGPVGLLFGLLVGYSWLGKKIFGKVYRISAYIHIQMLSSEFK
jgi:hypothetical protein